MEIVPKETLEALRNELPHGAMIEIAEKTNYSLGYVSQIFRGEKPITLENISMIHEAQKLIRNHRDKIEIERKKIEQQQAELNQ